ncbi:hypothetical protein AGOR_G00181700 [Albula goreensis]|uniref:Uncharacterized protein n=1 Tax=Albula goreensis TaxID=1534307 RepID=A0A8T3CSG1_9TELE|nr:hypothetical protein AGOR_G00181700 [Albula goreensis]
MRLSVGFECALEGEGYSATPPSLPSHLRCHGARESPSLDVAAVSIVTSLRTRAVWSVENSLEPLGPPQAPTSDSSSLPPSSLPASPPPAPPALGSSVTHWSEEKSAVPSIFLGSE